MVRCGICHDRIRDVRVTPCCLQLFCADCINRHCAFKLMETRVPKCPICASPRILHALTLLVNQEDLPYQRAMQRMIDEYVSEL